MQPLPPFDLNTLIAECRPGYSLPRPFYADEALHQIDLAQVFRTQWLYVGHLAMMPRAGDYLTYQVGDEPTLITRGRDGAVHALFNVCRHRGSILCDGESGHCKKLVCPYHQWVFDLDGSLQAARQMPADFKRADHALHRLHLQLVEGMIFICAAETPPDFARVAAGLTPILRPHDLSAAQLCVTRDYEVAANWKLVVENSRECYHCHFGHPEYSALMLSRPSNPADVARCALQDQERRAHYEKQGLTTRPAVGPGYRLSRYPFMRPGAVSESEDGTAVAPLMGTLTEPDAGVVGGYVFPNFMIECISDYTVIFRFTPLSARRTAIRATWLVRAGSEPGRDYDPARVTWFWHTTGEQDWKLCADNQMGVNSSRYAPGPYAPEERETVVPFIAWYLDQLRAGSLQPQRRPEPILI